MLDKNDLLQIKNIVQIETGKIVQEETKKIVQEEGASLKRDVSTLKSDVSMIRKDVKAIVSLFDRKYLELRKRVDRIEEHLGLSVS